MAEVHPRQAIAHHALLATVLAFVAALLVGAGAVILYYEVIDSDVVLTQDTPAPEVTVITPEQVTAARAMKDEARIAAGSTEAVVVRTDSNAPGTNVAASDQQSPTGGTPASGSISSTTPARVEGPGQIPVNKK